MKKKVNIKKIILGTFIVVILVLLVVTGLVHYAIQSSFSRGDYPDYPTAFYNYDHYRNDYPREEVSFYSGKNLLRGYLYGDKEASRLLIFSHGLGGGHEGYINEIIYLVDAGYLVFAYDAKGSGQSEGKTTVGVLQSALDLDAVFDYVNTSDELKDLPIYLMGHSWGGFAVAEALGRYENIVAVVALAGYAYPVDLLIDQGSQMVEKDLTVLKPFFYLSQLITYGPDNFRRNAVDSINSADITILLVHGSQDKMIPLKKTSIIAYEGMLRNTKVQTMILTEEWQNMHNNILHSAGANILIQEFKEELKEKISGIKDLPKEDQEELIIQFRKELVEKADLPTINQINEDLFIQIMEFYDEASR